MKPTTPTSREHARRWLWQMAKLVGAASSIVAIAWVIGVYGAEGEVDEARADIVDFGFGPKPSTQRFADALEGLGHDEPQTYSLNGNVVYFSVNYQDEHPLAVLARYQQAFVEAGLNDRAHTRLDADRKAAHARATTALTGGVVPQIISPSRIVMGGMLTKGGADSLEDLLREYDPTKDESELFKAHRFIEIYREPGSSQTAVIATWSAENFDYAKMIPELAQRPGRRGLRREQNADHDVDVDVPACPGCTRVSQFSDIETSPSPHRSNVYTTPMSPEQIASFYRRAMSARGWTSKDNPIFDRLQSQTDLGLEGMRSLEFGRAHGNDDEGTRQRLRIMIYRTDHQETAVHTTLTPEDDPTDSP